VTKKLQTSDSGAEGPRIPLNRDRVVQAAIELADEQGIGALSMRELARRLGVEAASLYNHVKGKDDILDGMADWAARQIELPAGAADWKEVMRKRAASAREVFARHAWASELVDSPERDSPARWEYVDGVLGVLLDAGFPPVLAGKAFFCIDSYIYGFARQAAGPSMDGAADSARASEQVLGAIPADALPNLSRVLVGFASYTDDDEALFNFGLDLILDGLERMLD
jgi:AcrR family transcriptional regulator